MCCLPGFSATVFEPAADGKGFSCGRFLMAAGRSCARRVDASTKVKPSRWNPVPCNCGWWQESIQGFWVAQPSQPGPAFDLLEAHGQVPLPPYVRKGRAVPADRQHYQTVFARQPGAVAAPTAGLHFTHQVFESLKRQRIDWCFVTLHVGPGTFQPLNGETIEHQHLHSEWGELSPSAAAAISACRSRGSRVVAVGTTSVRVLETVAASGPLRPWSGETDLYIYPPYPFRAVDALITNFHLPRTSLLVLVSAFAGIDLIRQAYRTAIERRYRFYSYGDAMLIL